VAFDGGGDAVAAFARGSSVQAADYNAAPALSGVQVPAAGVVGEALGFGASGADLWSPVAIAWDFGDGGKATGGQAGHSYAAAGDYVVTVTATDSAGNSSSEQRTIHVAAGGGGSDIPTDPPTGGSAAFRGLKIQRQTVKVRHGSARIKASCPVRTVRACTGTLRLVARHKVVGHARFKVAAGKRVRIRVRVTSVETVRATARAHDGAGAKRTTSARLKLRRG
jgi:hypothetical protein